jgi:4-hydroxy-tetrahydrodipicolinate synthase
MFGDFHLSGSAVALATPFRDGAIDTDALAALCERQITRGSTALVVCGTTGEGTSLTSGEYSQVVRIAVAASRGRLPVIAGCSAMATEDATALASLAAASGADGILCAPPAYVKPTQDGIFAHVRAVAHAANRPVMLYDVPGRTAVAVADDTVARLFEHTLITAIKDATGDLSRPARLRGLCGEALVQMSGDDATAAAYRAMGGHGCVSVTANLAPALCASLHRAWDLRDLAQFASIRDLLAPLHQALFMETNPVPLKAALGMLRLCAPDVRTPLSRAARPTRERLAEILSQIASAEEALAWRPRLALAAEAGM